MKSSKAVGSRELSFADLPAEVSCGVRVAFTLAITADIFTDPDATLINQVLSGCPLIDKLSSQAGIVGAFERLHSMLAVFNAKILAMLSGLGALPESLFQECTVCRDTCNTSAKSAVCNAKVSWIFFIKCRYENALSVVLCVPSAFVRGKGIVESAGERCDIKCAYVT
jgi:hypothetical protein